MGIYSRILHHISLEEMKDGQIKKNIKQESFSVSIRKAREFLRDLNSPYYSDWKSSDLKENMTTADVFVTTFPGVGEANLENIDASDVSAYTATGGEDALNGTSIKGNGSGSGSNGGFDVGQSYLAFDGDSFSRHAILDPIDSSKFDTMVIRGIVGNDTNGGEDPDVAGEELRLYYLDPNGSSFRSISVNPNGDQVLPANADVIIDLGAGNGSIQNFSISLPSYARGAGFTYMLYQLSNSGQSFDHYGITNIKYQRKGPVSLVVSLDSPEAVSFINDGSGGLTPAEKKKRLEDMLAASDEYLDTQFPLNQEAMRKAEENIKRNIEISLDPDTFKFPEYGTPEYNQMYNQKIDAQSGTEEIDRYLEQQGQTIDTIDKKFLTSLGGERQLLLINTPKYQEKTLAALGIDIGLVKNLTDDSYRQLNKKTYFTPGGTPATGWDGKFYTYNSPELEKSRIVPLQTYLEAKKRDGYYGVERPDIAPPGSRYVMEKKYGFSSDDDVTPRFTGPQNKTYEDQSREAERNIYRVGSYGTLGYTWDLSHFEKGLGDLEAGSNFARAQVIESMTAVLNHMYTNRDSLAFSYAEDANHLSSKIDITAEYDPLYFLLQDERGQRALQIASNSNASQLYYPLSSFGSTDPEKLKLYNDKKQDKAIAEFQKAYDRIKSMGTNFTSYDNDEWYVKNQGATGGQSNVTVGTPLKAHPYSGLTEPVNPNEPTEPTEPTEDNNYPPELNDLGGVSWEQGNTITKDGFKQSDGDFDIFVAGGGNAKIAQGFTYEQVMEIGRKNLNIGTFKNIDNKGDAQIQIKNNKVELLNYETNLGYSQSVDAGYGVGLDYALGLAPELGLSILTGQSREMKLSDMGKQRMIDSLDFMQFTKALKIGSAVKPTVQNAVKPTPGKKLSGVFTGEWGAPGGVEVDYNPKTDTLTFTSNKMLRVGEPGDEFGTFEPNDDFSNFTGGSIPGSGNDNPRQNRFGDIPPATKEGIASLSGTIITKMFGSVGINPPGGIPAEAQVQVLKDTFTENQFSNLVIGTATKVLDYTVQGSASNIVAVRNVLTQSGIVQQSEMEKTGGGYGHVYTQTSYTGDEIPKDIKQYIERQIDSKELGDGSLGDTLQGTDATDAATVGADNKKKKKVNENYEPKAKHNEKITKKMKSPKEFFKQADIKPVYPKDPPPEMINGRHPDWVDDTKLAKRFSKLDPESARAMPDTGSPQVDALIRATRKKPK